ncbi:MAG: glycosyltransferase family 2 protein [Clostridiales bacterium]|nr:glycosyltransferase family 2 protein [Clostridiales bacterium]
MEISVVVPVYGCKAALNELYRRLTDTLSAITEDYEIILVNDNCPQDSWSVINGICASDPKVIGIGLSRNFGQARAITAGLDHSSGNWIVVMDCDLQDKPEEIKKLYDKAQEGYDVVFANRKDRKDTGFKLFISRCFYRIYSFLSGNEYNYENNNFSIVRRKVVDSFCSMREYHRDYAMYVYWLGFKRTQIDVETEPRKEGRSSYNLARKINLAEDLLTSQSDKLLRVTAHTGFIMTLIAVLYIIFLVVQYFVSDINEGWTSIIAVILLVGGMLMTSIGIAGIYIGNIFMQTKDRPLYIIGETLNLPGASRKDE